ncbi:MAG: UDP-glucose 4-epimerase, partial [Proteobacteria bacterium]
MRLLVTGGAGYIGSHTVRELLDHGHQVWVIDDLSNGHQEAVDSRAAFTRGNTADSELLQNLMKQNKIEAVVHFAAFIEVGESVADPFKYYQNNFVNSLALLAAMKSAHVQKIVFSSTAAVYGNPTSVPIREDQTPNPINPYGRSKWMTEMALEDAAKAYGLGYTILRYFNVAGAHPQAEIGEDHHPE